MAGPPPSVDASDLWTKLSQEPRPSKEFDYPRKSESGSPGKVILWPLTEGELMACRAAAEAYAQEMLKGQALSKESLGYLSIFNSAMVVEYVCRAVRSTVDPVKLAAFPSPMLVRKFLHPDEIAVIYKAAEAWQAETGPILSEMTEPEMDAWIDKLGEGASRVPLSLLSSELQSDLLMRSAARLRAYSRGTSSAGSPPEGSSSDSMLTLDPSEQPQPVEIDASEVPPVG